MLGYLALAMTVVAIFAGSSAVAGVSDHGEVFNLTDPIRLSAIRYYEDGGTVSFTLVGAQAETLRGGFDGRLQRFGSRHQPHCYVGDEYPTGPQARSLSLWGSEERALVRLLMSVIGDSLPPKRIERLLSTTSAMRLPNEDSVELWHLVRAVDRRRQTHEAMDQGRLVSPVAAGQCFGVVSPIHADSIGVDRASGRFVVHIRDATARELQVSFPASPDSAMAASSGSWPVRWAWEYYLAGTSEDRLLMTMISAALGATPDDGSKRPSEASSTQYQEGRATLLRLLGMRTARILEADAKE